MKIKNFVGRKKFLDKCQSSLRRDPHNSAEAIIKNMLLDLIHTIA
jgi:hypothetical protein